jgi:hypothetical protein
VTAAPGARTGILRSALLLVALLALGLTLGVLVPGTEALRPLAIPALAVQTTISAGSLPTIPGRSAVKGGLLLLGVHHLVATLPVALVAFALGVHTPHGFGVFMIAVAPPAALIPAFALLLDVEGAALLVFCLTAYALSWVATPLALLAVAGATVGPSAIAVTLAAGLIAPSILGRLLRVQVQRLPPRVRRGIVNASVFVITLGLGSGLPGGLASAPIGWVELAAIVAVVAGRTFGCGWLATRVVPRALRAQAPLAGGFKNIALAAAVAGTLLGPPAALPALISFAAESAYFLFLAGRRARAIQPA